MIIDLFSLRIIGWACSDRPDSQLTTKAFLVSFEARGQPEGVMFHSDQGSHYTSLAYQNILRQRKVIQSMSRRGNCWDTESILFDTDSNDLTRARIDQVSLC